MSKGINFQSSTWWFCREGPEKHRTQQTVWCAFTTGKVFSVTVRTQTVLSEPGRFAEKHDLSGSFDMICIFPRTLSFISLTQAKKHLELYVVFITFYAKAHTVILDSSSLPWHTMNDDKKMKVMRRSVLRFILLLQK